MYMTLHAISSLMHFGALSSVYLLATIIHCAASTEYQVSLLSIREAVCGSPHCSWSFQGAFPLFAAFESANSGKWDLVFLLRAGEVSTLLRNSYMLALVVNNELSMSWTHRLSLA